MSIDQPMRRSLLVVWFALALGISSPCAAEWRRLDSPNFVIIGEVNARSLRDVAIAFEGFRETLTRVMTERATATPVPTIIVVFPTDRAFTPFKPVFQGKPGASSGVFIGRQDANYIAIVSDGDADRLRVVFHEYAHLVVSSVMRNVPSWLSEGLAEFYSTYELGRDGREAVLGRVIPHHLRRLQDTQLLKLEELLNVDRRSPLYNETERRSVFYAQSWALTHLILRGQPARTKELFAYLNRVSDGVPPMVAWRQAFGTTDVERELDEYIRRQPFQTAVYTFPEKLAKFDGVATPLPAADAEAFLGELLLRIGRPDEAAARLAAAATLTPGSARLRTVAALQEIERGDYEKASERLLSIGEPTDWLIAYSAAAGIAEIVTRRSEPPSSNQVEAARRLFGVVRQQHGDLANALARLASVELKSAEGPSKDTRTAIERARLMATGRDDYVFIHAQVLARLSEFGAARNVVSPLLSPLYPQETRDAARTLIGNILRLEAASELTARTADPPGAEQPSPLTPADSKAADPPTTGPSGAIYRELRVGEQRLEGMLERIECGAKGSAMFHIRTADGVARISGRMANVDFVTYRDDLSGSIGCGPMKPPVSIYLTWRPDPSKSIDKVAVAIEFLPK